MPNLTTAELVALAKGLRENDPALIQYWAALPKPLLCEPGCPCEGACAIGYCAWKGNNLTTVNEVEERFEVLCSDANRTLNDEAACRWFLNWFDYTARDVMRAVLLDEVNLALAVRGPVAV